MNEETAKRIAAATERIATALETIAECEVKSVALSNKFADTNENLNSVLNLIKGKPPEINDEEAEKLDKYFNKHREEFKLQSYND